MPGPFRNFAEIKFMLIFCIKKQLPVSSDDIVEWDRPLHTVFLTTLSLTDFLTTFISLRGPDGYRANNGAMVSWLGKRNGPGTTLAQQFSAFERFPEFTHCPGFVRPPSGKGWIAASDQWLSVSADERALIVNKLGLPYKTESRRAFGSACQKWTKCSGLDVFWQLTGVSLHVWPVSIDHFVLSLDHFILAVAPEIWVDTALREQPVTPPLGTKGVHPCLEGKYERKQITEDVLV